ncbi:hypothetical protein HK096_009811, partial [Nowakowskiella sp. JEL0078]
MGIFSPIQPLTRISIDSISKNAIPIICDSQNSINQAENSLSLCSSQVSDKSASKELELLTINCYNFKIENKSIDELEIYLLDFLTKVQTPFSISLKACCISLKSLQYLHRILMNEHSNNSLQIESSTIYGASTALLTSTFHYLNSVHLCSTLSANSLAKLHNEILDNSTNIGLIEIIVDSIVNPVRRTTTHLRILALPSMGMKTDTVTSLLRCIPVMLEVLDISGNQWSPVSADQSVVLGMKFLRKFSAARVSLNLEATRILRNVLLTGSIQTLRLDGNWKLREFSELLAVECAVKEISLDECVLGTDGVSALGSVLRSWKDLEVVSLKRNNISCEGLTEFLKMLSTVESNQPKFFRELQFEGNWITDDGLKSACEILKTYEVRVDMLGLSKNRVKTKGVELFVNQDIDFRMIGVLDLSFNLIGKSGIEILSRFMKACNDAMQIKVDGNVGNSFQSRELNFFENDSPCVIRKVSEHNISIKKQTNQKRLSKKKYKSTSVLNPSNDGVSFDCDEDYNLKFKLENNTWIFESLSAHQQFQLPKQLLSLTTSFNDYTSASSYSQHQVFNLRIIKTHFTILSTSIIMKSLLQFKNHLVLTICSCTFESDEVCAIWISECLAFVHTLIMDDCNITDSSLATLYDSSHSLSNYPILISLPNNSISKLGVETLLNVLIKIQRPLFGIDLRNNRNIGGEGVRLLCRMLANNPALVEKMEVLEIGFTDCCFVSRATVSDIAGLIRVAKGLKRLGVAGNMIDDISVEELIKAAIAAPALVALDLRWNWVSISGWERVQELMIQEKKLWEWVGVCGCLKIGFEIDSSVDSQVTALEKVYELDLVA